MRRYTLTLPPFDDMATDVETLSLLSALVCYERPTVAVEAGTYRGHDALYMAAALKGGDIPGHVWTADPVDYGFSAFLGTHELREYVTAHQVTFEEMLPLVPTPIDFAFVDASDRRPGFTASSRLVHVAMLLPLMRPGGLIMVHDTGSEPGSWAGLEAIRQMGDINLSGPRGLTLIQVKR